jgi:lysophospholipase L1-like esterase
MRSPPLRLASFTTIAAALLATAAGCSTRPERADRLPPASQPPATTTTAPATRAVPREVQWRREVDAFLAADRAAPPPANPIIFVGSSSIRGWRTLSDDFAGLPAIGRGIGGTRLDEVNGFVDEVVTPYRPRCVVLYAGENDIAAGQSPENVLADYRDFVARVRRTMPDVPIVFISLKPSPSRWNKADQFRRANELIRDAIARGGDRKLTFVDVWQPMLGPDGQPRPELFGPDRLHMTRAGYALWTGIVRPHVEGLLAR